MEERNEQLFFSIENKETKEVLYEYGVELLPFQEKTVKTEGISFYYTFKDIIIELEENIDSKMELSSKGDKILFTVKYNDNILCDQVLDISKTITSEDIKKNEIKLYFIFEKISKIFINKIVEEHKNLLLNSGEIK